MNNKVAFLISIIVATLLIAAYEFSIQLPQQTSTLINIFLPFSFNLVESHFLQFRILAYVSLTIWHVIFFGFILFKRIPDLGYLGNRRDLKIGLFVFVLAWVVLPFIGICTSCFLKFDFVYSFALWSLAVSINLAVAMIFSSANKAIENTKWT